MDRSAAMLLLFMTFFGLLILLLAMFAVAPIFTSLTLALFYALYHFVRDEKSGIHNAQEHENQFWTIFWLIASTVVCFAKDSPFAVGIWSPSLGFLIVLGCGLIVNMYDRHLHRIHVSRSHASLRLRSTDVSVTSDDHRSASSTITSITNLTDSYEYMSRSSRLSKRIGGDISSSAISVSSASNTIGSRDSSTIEHYNQLLNRINKALLIIDDVLVPSTIQKLMRRQRIFQSEKLILNIMGGVAGTGLNYILARVKLSLIIYKIKDHQSSPTEHNRTSLIELLAVKRIGVLNTISKVHLLHALQALRLSANKRGEFWVRNVFLKTHGAELSLLKTLMDSKGDYYCMNKLIFEDIRTKSVRDDILLHFQAQPCTSTRKVLSDVDDTLICSGGVWPAGVDRRFKRKIMYPGVTAFYRELDSGYDGDVGNLTFISARPHFYKDWAESHSFEKFRKMVDKGLMHCTPSLLTGDVKSGTEFIVKNNYEPLARRKFKNFADYVCIYPEFKHIFIGDNGQGDLKAAFYMMASFPEHLQAVYIHLVQPLTQAHGYVDWFTGDDNDSNDDESDTTSVSSIQSKSSHKSTKSSTIPSTQVYKPVGRSTVIPHHISARVPLHFFHTYIDAALHAFNHTFFDISSLLQICYDTVHDFMKIDTWPSSGSNKHVRELRGIEINNDLWRVNVRLNELYENNLLPVDVHPLSQQDYESLDSLHASFDLKLIFVRYIHFERKWNPGQLVLTSYGRGRVRERYDSVWDLYQIDLDWRPLDVQLSEASKLNSSKDTCPNFSNSPQSPFSVSIPQTPKSNTSDFMLPTVDLKDTGLTEIIPKESLSTTTTDQYSYRTLKSDHTIGAINSSIIDETNYDFSVGDIFDNEEAIASRNSVITIPSCDQSSPSRIFQSDLLSKSATICGNNISPYAPPSLPKKSSSRFRFFGGSGKQVEKYQLQIGKEVSTPYGSGSIIKVDDSVSILLSFGKMYSTRESVRGWIKESNNGNLLSSISSLVTNLLPSKKTESIAMNDRRLGKHSASTDSILYEQYFCDGACVQTPYGFGRISSFQEVTGIYSVVLNWPFNHHKAIAYMTRNDISTPIACGCQLNKPVMLKSLNIRGELKSIAPTTGVHLVSIRGNNMKCYVADPTEIEPVLALNGDEVKTPFGIGTVLSYHPKTKMYKVNLSWGILYSMKVARLEMKPKDGQRHWRVLSFFLGK